jgi:hypothetical protein
LPVSVAFDPDPGGMVRWPADPLSENLSGVQRTRVKLLDIAIVDKAQYPGACTYSRGSWRGCSGWGTRRHECGPVGVKPRLFNVFTRQGGEAFSFRLHGPKTHLRPPDLNPRCFR